MERGGPLPSLRPPRYDRLSEQAAFHLGYSPYQFWYDFTEEENEPDPDCQRWLQDLPVMLTKYFPPYTRKRYVATGLFSRHPTGQEPGKNRKKLAVALPRPRWP
jgi:hypothetical protein